MDLTKEQKAEIASEVEKNRKRRCRRGGRNTKRVCHNWSPAIERRINNQCATCDMLDNILEKIGVIPQFEIEWFEWLEDNDFELPNQMETEGIPVNELVYVSKSAEIGGGNYGEVKDL